MQKLFILLSDALSADSTTLHSFITNEVKCYTIGGSADIELTLRDQPDGFSYSTFTIAEEDVNPLRPYTVKLAQYITVGAPVIVVVDDIASNPLASTMNYLCGFWECVYNGSSRYIAWGISRVQKTDFSDPEATVISTNKIYVYEAANYAAASQSSTAILGVDNFSVARPTNPLLIGSSSGTK